MIAGKSNKGTIASRADSRGANKSLKTVGIPHAPEAPLPACSCHRLAPPLPPLSSAVMSDNLNIAAIIPLIITALVAVVGWFIVHELLISRDIKNKRIELKIKYLIEAYRRLEHILHRDNPDLKDFESAIADIQLFGTKEQAELAREVALEFAKNRTASLDPLLGDLREDLRTLLHLEHLQGPPIIIRWKER